MAERPDLEEQGLKDKVIFINRVAKVVKGGKRLALLPWSLSGDKHGSIGVGQGKAAEVPEAIRKAVEKAKKQMVKVSLKNTTIPYTVMDISVRRMCCSNRHRKGPALLQEDRFGRSWMF